MSKTNQRSVFSYLSLLLNRLLFVLFLFTITRILFYYFNKDLLAVQSFSELVSYLFYGIRFDIAALIYVNALFIFMSIIPFSFRENFVYKKIQHIIFVLMNGFAFLMEFSDMGYFQFAYRRINRSDLAMLSTNQSTTGSFLIDFWYLLTMFLITAFLLYFYVSKSERKSQASPSFISQILLFLACVLVFGIGARGGLQKRPVMAITAAQYVKDMANMPLLTNASLNLIFSFQQRYLPAKNYYPQDKADQLFPILHHPKPDSTFKKDNVVIIVLESFGKEYIGHFNEYEGSTPFLDSLLNQGLYVEQTYANGSRSTEGIVAITAGIPSLMQDPIMFSAYQSNRIDGTAALLKKKGYHSSFYHAANKGSMEFERFALLSGFDEYIDRDEYGMDKDYDGTWGIWDDKFFQFFADKMSTTPTPFYSVIFSMTSHHPFNAEEWFEKKYPDERPLYRSVRYTDYALRHFFETAQKMDWFENTLFVITADHIGESYEPSYKNEIGKYKVPILFYKPNSIQPTKQAGLMQQIDIQPSILDYLNFDLPHSSFGKSVFSVDEQPVSKTDEQYTYIFSGGIYKFLDSQFLLLNDGKTSIGLYDYQADPMLKTNLVGKRKDVVIRLEGALKLVVQQYHYSVRENAFVRH